MTVRLPEATKERLGQLSERTRRSPSVLAGEAISACVERQPAIIVGIEQGLADMQAGRVIPHEEVIAEIDTILEDAPHATSIAPGARASLPAQCGLLGSWAGSARDWRRGSGCRG